MNNKKKSFYQLVETVEKLLSENGCPWDKAQTLSSLRQYLLEETYELLSVMESGPEKHLEELGDLLFQIVFQSALRQRRGDFDIDAVAKKISQKLINRHPHVFSKENNKYQGENQWELNKKSSKNSKSMMDDIPHIFPALLESEKIQRRAAATGFEWPDISGPKLKIEEEMQELERALWLNDPKNIQEESGDLLFAVVNYIRFAGINPEVALKDTNKKFMERFRYMEKTAKSRGVQLEDLSLEEMEELWVLAKKAEKG
ncbi:MAG: nucleoside triphosphate pyrophosphohydrolase [Myxococcota bacterium]